MTTTPHSFYLAGPMTGIPQFNFPAFDAAAAELRDQGYEIVSPAELDDPFTREAALASPDGAPGSGSANDESYGTFLGRDVKLIIDDVDGVMTLPEWWKSRGARIEVFTALTMGKPVYAYISDGSIYPWTRIRLEELLKPGDPGNGAQHQTAAEAVGPPIEPYAASREPGHIREELREGHQAEEFLAQAGVTPPGGEERITSETGGQKGQKLCAIGDLDPKALMAVGEVAGFGAKKYARLNYTKGFNWSLAFNALMRHALLFWSGEDYDEESELPHMAHAAWQCLCLLTFAEHMRGTDDRHINFYMEGGPREFEDVS